MIIAQCPALVAVFFSFHLFDLSLHFWQRKKMQKKEEITFPKRREREREQLETWREKLRRERVDSWPPRATSLDARTHPDKEDEDLRRLTFLTWRQASQTASISKRKVSHRFNPARPALNNSNQRLNETNQGRREGALSTKPNALHGIRFIVIQTGTALKNLNQIRLLNWREPPQRSLDHALFVRGQRKGG